MSMFQIMARKRGRDDDSDSEIDEDRYIKVRHFGIYLQTLANGSAESPSSVYRTSKLWRTPLPIIRNVASPALAYALSAEVIYRHSIYDPGQIRLRRSTITRFSLGRASLHIKRVE